MTLDQYMSGLLYAFDDKLNFKNSEPRRGEEALKREINSNLTPVFYGRCPLCYPIKKGGDHIPFALDPDLLKKKDLLRTTRSLGYGIIGGDTNSFYLWTLASLYFKSMRGCPYSTGFAFWDSCQANHHRATHVFLDFHGKRPDFQRLKDLGFPYLNPEVPFLIPYLMNHRSEVQMPISGWEGELGTFHLGGTATIVQGTLPDPWLGTRVTYTLVSTYAQMDKWPKDPHPVWDHIIGEGSSKATMFDGDTFPVKNYIHPVTGQVIPLEAWYDWKPWVEAGLVTWWTETKPGHYEEQAWDWEKFPLKDQSGRKRILHLEEITRSPTERDSFYFKKELNTWEEIQAFYDSQDFDEYDLTKIKEGFRSLGHSIFGGDE